MHVHTTHMDPPHQVSMEQVNTIDLIQQNGMVVNIWGQNPFSTALICECVERDFTAPRWEIPVFTVITASGQVYCPYTEGTVL